MKKTETETRVEEEDVERVYCDKCGDECTDRYGQEIQDVCPDCAKGDSLTEKLTVNPKKMDGTPIQHISMCISMVVFFPLGLYLNVVDHETPDDWIVFLGISFGAVLWTLLITGIIIMII